MVERWTRDAQGFVTWPDGEWVRYSDYAALEAQLAKLAAENERLREQITKATDPTYLEEKLRQIGVTDEMATEALSRTGAVKVDDIDRRAKEAADAIGVTPHSDMRLFVEQAAKYALSALEQAAPEGEQEADAVLASALKLAREYRPTMDKDILHSWASDAVKVIRVLSDRPTERTVTDAMVEAACEAFGLHERKHGLDHRQAGMREALKAAMEAGR